MPNDVPDWTGRVVVDSGSVSISGTPTVDIGGPVTATITAGTIEVENVANGILSAAGNLRYVGSIAVSGSGTATLAVTLAPLERSIVAFYYPVNQGSGSLTLDILKASGGLFTQSVYLYRNGVPNVLGVGSVPVVGYCNPDLTTAWVVQTDSNDASADGTVYVFADTNLPDAALVSPEQPLPVGVTQAEGSSRSTAYAVSGSVNGTTVAGSIPGGSRLVRCSMATTVNGNTLGGTVGIADLDATDGTTTIGLIRHAVYEGGLMNSEVVWPFPNAMLALSGNITIQVKLTFFAGSRSMISVGVIEYL